MPVRFADKRSPEESRVFDPGRHHAAVAWTSPCRFLRPGEIPVLLMAQPGEAVTGGCSRAALVPATAVKDRARMVEARSHRWRPRPDRLVPDVTADDDIRDTLLDREVGKRPHGVAQALQPGSEFLVGSITSSSKRLRKITAPPSSRMAIASSAQAVRSTDLTFTNPETPLSQGAHSFLPRMRRHSRGG